MAKSQAKSQPKVAEKLAQWLRAAEVNLCWSHNIDGEIKIEIVKPETK